MSDEANTDFRPDGSNSAEPSKSQNNKTLIDIDCMLTQFENSKLRLETSFLLSFLFDF